MLLTGLLAARLTANRFDLFVTEEGKRQAERIAPLLEASYLLHGDWSKVDALWRQPSQLDVQTPLSVTVDGLWQSDVDWTDVTAKTLGMNRDILWAEYGASKTLATVGEQYGKSVEELTAAILAAERQATEAAVADGTIAADVAQSYLQPMPDQIRAFLTAPGYGTTVDWNAITAAQLGLTKPALIQALTRQTIAQLAKARGVNTQLIAQAIIGAEVVEFRRNHQFGEDEAVSLLSQAIAWVDEYLGQPVALDPVIAPAPTNEPTGLLAGYLYGGERLLIVDQEGHLQYDSTGTLLPGDQLPTTMVAQGVPLHLWPIAEPIGALLIATGPGYYSSQQQTFLRSVTYSLILSGALVALVGLLAAFWLSRQIIAPVAALTTAAQQIADGRTDARLPVTARDELGQMSATFNQMAEALATQRTLRQRLVNDISHELGTPLSVIQLEMQALRDGLQTPTQAMEQVQGEIELLRNLIKDLGNLETTDNGQLALQCEPIDLLALTQRAMKRWQSKAETRGITLTLAAPVDLLPLTEADADRLTQVLGNLLDNALRHTPDGGAITITCQVATLASLTLPAAYRPSAAPKAPGLVVMINDTGCGIPAVDLPHLFERFYRVDSSRDRRSGGRGLGLAIVRQIITAHGGYIWARSIEGQGSTFGFWLPITEAE